MELRSNAAGKDASGKVLRHYLALECASAEMLRAARAGDWDSVCRLEGACAVVIAQLRVMTRGEPLPEEDQMMRIQILRAILANDAEIRRICEPQPEAMDTQAFREMETSPTLH
jgi:flagellar protein FliT